MEIDTPAAPANGQPSGTWSGAIRAVAVFVVYAVLTAIFFRVVVAHMSTALLGPPEDNLQDFWNALYVTEYDRAHFFFTTLIKFPEGTSLYYHSFAYPLVVVFGLATSLIGTDVPHLLLAQNALVLLSFPLAGLGAFYCVRRLTGDFWCALLGGYIFAFNPSHIEQAQHHLHVSFIAFIPFFVVCYWTALDRKSYRWLAAAVVCYVLSALCSWYYFFYIGYFIAFHTAYLWIRRKSWPRGWEMHAPLIVVGATVALLLPILVPMIREASAGNVYALGHDDFVADLLGYFTFPPLHLLSAFTAVVNRHLSGNEWEATVYLGLANVGVLVWYLRQKAKHPAVTYLLAGSAVFAVLASGAHLHVFGHRTLPMPDMLLSHLPIVRNVRTPSRAIVFDYLFLAAFIGLAIKQLAQRGPPARSLVVAGLVALMIVDFYPAHVEITPFSCNAGLSLIRDDPEQGFGVLNLPGGGVRAYNSGNADMAEQACHHRPVVQGNISRDVTKSLRDILEVTDLTAQRTQLADARVKYIVLRRADSGVYLWRAEDGDRQAYLNAYPIAYQDADVAILRVYGDGLSK